MKGLTRIFRRAGKDKASQEAAEKKAALARLRVELLDSTALSSGQMTIRQTLSAAWKLARPFFIESPHRHKARLMVAGIGGWMLTQVGLLHWSNNVMGQLMQNFSNPSLHSVAMAGLQTALILPLFLTIPARKELLVASLMMHWRDYMSRREINNLMEYGAYYGLHRSAGMAIEARQEATVKTEDSTLEEDTENENAEDKESKAKKEEENIPPPEAHPDQRLSDDVNEYIFDTVFNGMHLTESAVRLGWFAVVLHNLSGALDANIGGFSIHIPAYMLILSGLWSGLGTWWARRTGNSLSTKYSEQQANEAEYRHALIRIQENTESIALLGGEKAEGRRLNGLLDSVLKTAFDVAKKDSALTGFYSAFGHAASLLPAFALLPKAFAGALDVDGGMRGVGAFAYMDQSLSWMAYSWSRFARSRARIGRLTAYTRAVEEWNRKAMDPEAQNIRREISHDPDRPVEIRVENLSLDLPDGGRLIEAFNLHLRSGDRVRIKGDSGCGKTTLNRILAGLKWHFGSGRVEINLPGGGDPKDQILGAPQDSYLPTLNLRGIICYPKDPQEFDDAAVRDALRTAGLGKYEKHLDNNKIKGKDWAEKLSGGQKQRINFARLFLHRPEIISLDESASALDAEAGEKLYAELIRRLPGSIILSIIHHNEAVAAQHNLQIDISNGVLTGPVAVNDPQGAAADLPREPALRPAPVPA